MPDLATLPGGTSVFVDTNILHYHFEGRSVTCTDFITRIAVGDIEAYVNVQVLSDLLHKLMFAEARRKQYVKSSNPQEFKKFLKGQRGQPWLLTDYQQQFEDILALGLHVLPITEKLLVETRYERETYCLMTGDSLHVGSMNRRVLGRRKYPLRDIVTHDGDFATIPDLTVWQPGDVV